MGVTTVTRDLLGFLLPAPCLSCGRWISEPRPWLGLCAACRADLRPARPDVLPGLQVVAAWQYRPPIDAVVTGLKFRQLEYLGAHLAQGLAPRLTALPVIPEWIVPVPLHWWRRLRRGYNQAESIAQPLAAALQRPLVRALARGRTTAPQVGRSRSGRLANLQGAFQVPAPLRAALAGRTVLLVDDVATTGATFAAATAALLAAGAAEVVAAAATATPRVPS